jgi:secondary thiamine-phosphate synthase enzyme
MQTVINIQTSEREELVDITSEIKRIINENIDNYELCNIYVQGATAAIMIQENWDQSVQSDVVNFLRKLIPKGIWQHDLQDGNGDAHIKSGLIGPSETIPIIDGKLGLSTWQNIFLCEFDGPRKERKIVVTLK